MTRPAPSRTRGARHDSETPPVTPTWRVTTDLHLHSNASDGTLAPAALIDLVASRGISVAALTDHDTTAGLSEAQAAAERHPRLTLIPGVEITATIDTAELHLTCHFIDPANPELQSALKRITDDRLTRAKQMVERLAELGISLDWDHILASSGTAVGRPHIGRAIVAAGHATTLQHAFSELLNPGQHAYVPRAKFDIFDALTVVHTAGGVATVAHPRTARDLHLVIGNLADAGLAGIEVYAEKYDAEQIGYYADMADRHGLVKSGGTDYHANGALNETKPGMNGPPPGTAKLLYERAIQMHGDRVGTKFNPEDLA